MSKFPQAEQAFIYTRKSYEDMGGMPEQLLTLYLGAAKTINKLIDRPDDEKDALIAASALLFSKDMIVYKEAPENITTYSPQVQQIVEDVAAHRGQPDLYLSSPDLMQIGLSYAIGGKDIIYNALKEMKEQIEEIAQEDKRLLKPLLRSVETAAAEQAQVERYFTGEQPRLESAARELMNEVRSIADGLTAQIHGLLSADARDKPSAPKRGGKSFDL